MNKTDLIAIAVRLLSEKSSLIPKPDPVSETINSFFGVEPYEKRVARAIEDDLAKAYVAARNVSTRIKFRKITKNF